MHVTCSVCGPTPSSSGDAEYSPRPDVRLKPGNGEWENGGVEYGRMGMGSGRMGVEGLDLEGMFYTTD